MKANNIQLIEKNRKDTSIKSLYFNRYLMVRYAMALFLFTNIYWLLSLLITKSFFGFVPLILIIVISISMMEQVVIYSSHTNNAKYSRFTFIFLLCSNMLFSILLLFSVAFNHLFPFLVNQSKSKILMLAFLILGILINMFVINRLYKIKNNNDKHYKRIKKYEEAINL